uniref:Uncharacterized protein n=1 Tax=Populus trichocarpa TaxID=3694 RepID=U5FV26_POPTR
MLTTRCVDNSHTYYHVPICTCVISGDNDRILQGRPSLSLSFLKPQVCYNFLVQSLIFKTCLATSCFLRRAEFASYLVPLTYSSFILTLISAE